MSTVGQACMERRLLEEKESKAGRKGGSMRGTLELTQTGFSVTRVDWLG